MNNKEVDTTANHSMYLERNRVAEQLSIQPDKEKIPRLLSRRWI